MFYTSEIRISIVCRESDLERGVKAAHTALGLDADQVEANEQTEIWSELGHTEIRRGARARGNRGSTKSGIS
jgi:hypothetical protein